LEQTSRSLARWTQELLDVRRTAARRSPLGVALRRARRHARAPAATRFASRHVGHRGERALGETLLLHALVAHALTQLVDQTEVRVHRLEVARVGLAHVAVERAEHRRRQAGARAPRREAAARG
jgi:hypothetical protein